MVAFCINPIRHAAAPVAPAANTIEQRYHPFPTLMIDAVVPAVSCDAVPKVKSNDALNVEPEDVRSCTKERPLAFA